MSWLHLASFASSPAIIIVNNNNGLKGRNAAVLSLIPLQSPCTAQAKTHFECTSARTHARTQTKFRLTKYTVHFTSLLCNKESGGAQKMLRGAQFVIHVSYLNELGAENAGVDITSAHPTSPLPHVAPTPLSKCVERGKAVQTSAV